ncbi:MAG: hypothetical protein ABFC95_09415, partial [Smithella sp.]
AGHIIEGYIGDLGLVRDDTVDAVNGLLWLGEHGLVRTDDDPLIVEGLSGTCQHAALLRNGDAFQRRYGSCGEDYKMIEAWQYVILILSFPRRRESRGLKDAPNIIKKSKVLVGVI